MGRSTVRISEDIIDHLTKNTQCHKQTSGFIQSITCHLVSHLARDFDFVEQLEKRRVCSDQALSWTGNGPPPVFLPCRENLQTADRVFGLESKIKLSEWVTGEPF